MTAEHDDGWWEGSVGSGAFKHTGFFPRSHVTRRESGKGPSLPPRPSHLSASPSSASGPEEGAPGKADAAGHMEYEVSVALGDQFSLDSLELFDELMDHGYAIDVKTKGSGDAVAVGSRVTLSLKAKTWDGAATVVHAFAEGALAWTVGDAAARLQLPNGLIEAVGKLSVGTNAIVTCAPHMAYGDSGRPPHVKPNSHIVYDVTVVSAEPATEAPVDGHADFFKTSVQDSKHKATGRRGSARITSVVFDSSPVGAAGAGAGAGGEASSTDALIAQALASGLNVSSK